MKKLSHIAVKTEAYNLVRRYAKIRGWKIGQSTEHMIKFAFKPLMDAEEKEAK